MGRTDRNIPGLICDILDTRDRLCHLSSSSCFFFPGPVPVVLQGSTGVPGELWPLCNITTPLPGQTSQESAKCPISATIQSLDPLKIQVPPCSPSPPRYQGFWEEKGVCSQSRQTDSTNHRAPRWLIQPHEIFCFKNTNRNITKTLTNMTTVVQMRQRRPAADLSEPNLPDCQRLLLALKEHSLWFYGNYFVNIMIHYVKCYSLVYLLFLLIILTSDISSVLNCPAWGVHYFHNLYFFYVYFRVL